MLRLARVYNNKQKVQSACLSFFSVFINESLEAVALISEEH